mgnify:CR=1 FL=1
MIFIDFIATVAVYIIGSILLIGKHLMQMALDLHYYIGDIGVFLILYPITVAILHRRNCRAEVIECSDSE